MESDTKIPQHIAIIMDGNRRWAKGRNLPPAAGHKEGYKRFTNVLEDAANIGVKTLTFYTFSTENWKRSQAEVEALMDILRLALNNELTTVTKNNIKFKVIGRVNDLPADIQKKIKEIEEISKENTGIELILAISYGGRLEIVDAIKEMMNEGLKAEDIDEIAVSKHLYSPSTSEPELVIRTGGEKRLSNFLLWQSSYSELYFTDVLWPDFDLKELEKAINFYSDIKRNFGK